MEGVIASFAQFDNDQRSERTEAGMRAALQLGRWTFKAPLGYLNSGTERGPSLVHDLDRVPLVRLAFTLVADGRPVADVLRTINAAGLKAAKGGHPSLQSFRSLLQNPIYAGTIRIPKWGVSGRSTSGSWSGGRCQDTGEACRRRSDWIVYEFRNSPVSW